MPKRLRSDSGSSNESIDGPAAKKKQHRSSSQRVDVLHLQYHDVRKTKTNRKKLFEQFLQWDESSTYSEEALQKYIAGQSTQSVNDLLKSLEKMDNVDDYAALFFALFKESIERENPHTKKRKRETEPESRPRKLRRTGSSRQSSHSGRRDSLKRRTSSRAPKEDDSLTSLSIQPSDLGEGEYDILPDEWPETIPESEYWLLPAEISIVALAKSLINEESVEIIGQLLKENQDHLEALHSHLTDGDEPHYKNDADLMKQVKKLIHEKRTEGAMKTLIKKAEESKNQNADMPNIKNSKKSMSGKSR